MKIEQIGRTKSMCKAEIRFATAFFAQYLMSMATAKKLELEIEFANQGNAEGHCMPVDDGKLPKSFQIGLNPKLRRYKMLQTLAHEMVHVKQYATGELSQERLTAKFNGKDYKITANFEDYLNWPWEIEAYGRDRALYLFYQMMLKQEKIKFKNGKMYMKGKYVPLTKKKT